MRRNEIWLINPYGPVPSESWRDYRYTNFGIALSRKGWKVIWWTASFSHHFKTFRTKGWHDENINDHFIIRYVPTTSYKSNFGFGRIVKDIVFSYRTYKRAKNMIPPKLIISADNPLCLGWPSIKLAKKLSTKVVYDQMDIWPEFMEKSTPSILRPFMRMLLTPFYINRNKNYDKCDGILALGKNYLNFAITKSKTLSKKPSVCVYNGVDVKQVRDYMKSSTDIIPEKKPEEIWCVFAGTLGVSYDIKTILKVSIIFAKSNRNVKFIIAGDGPFRNDVLTVSKETDNLVYLGKIKPNDLFAVYSKCDIGLMTYTSKSNVDMPDKIYDYTSAGLAIVNSLRDEARDVVVEEKCGLNYECGDVNSLYNSINKLTSDKEFRNKCCENSYSIGTQYDIFKQIDKLDSFFNELFNE